MQRTFRIAMWVFAAGALLSGCGGGGGGSSGGIAVNISPDTASLTVQDSRSFTAAVSGTANIAVDWSIQEPNSGTIASTGDQSALYTAPDRSVTCHVVATSRADASKTSVAVVKVFEMPPPPPP